MSRGSITTDWSSGLRTKHPKGIQEKLNAGKDVFLSTDGSVHFPGHGEPFTVKAILPLSSDGDVSGLLLVALKFPFQAYMADPERVSMVVSMMESAGRPFVYLRILVTEEGDIKILTELKQIIKGLDF